MKRIPRLKTGAFVGLLKKLKTKILSIFDEVKSADPCVGVTWCVFVDTMGKIGTRQPFFVHFDLPGEAIEWADSMVESGFAISEPFYCDSPENSRCCFIDSGGRWRHPGTC